MIEDLENNKEGIVISGDGRHDSMGHSAKYCAYTIFCCTKPKLIHFNLVQVMFCIFCAVILPVKSQKHLHVSYHF